MKWITIPAGEWLPDQSVLDNPGSTVAKNCLPSARGYIPFRGPVANTIAPATSTTDRIRGAIAAKASTGVAYVIAGDAGALYQQSATIWDDISTAASGKYSGTATDERWTFSQWGDQIVANNFNNVPQVMTLGAPPFAALGGSPPRARYSCVVRDFLVLGYLQDGSVRPNRVRWSAFNNITSWTPNIATQADQQDLFEGGWITGITGGQYGTIFQETAITIMQYVGPPSIFTFDRVKDSVGCQVPGSIVKFGSATFFQGRDDFYVFDSGQLTPLGAEKIARTILVYDYDAHYSARVWSSVDPLANIVYWIYAGNTNNNGRPNRMLAYHWPTGKWSSIEQEAEIIFPYLSPGYTMEGLDVINSSLDGIDGSLDSAAWEAGARKLAAFDKDHRLIVFDNPSLTATIETAELRAAPGARNEIINARVLFDGSGTATVTIGTREQLTDNVTWHAPTLANPIGEHNLRVNARFVRARIQPGGNWTSINGIDLQFRSGGNR